MPRTTIEITAIRKIHCTIRSLAGWSTPVLFLLFLLTGPDAPAQMAPRAAGFTLTVDAGHGGHDPGAVGKKAQEKNIALNIARKFGHMVETGMSDVNVVYTRSSDVFIPVYQRAAIANRNKSDLFVSIHVNANKNQGLFGSETYVMGLSKSEDNMDVVLLENKVIKLEDDYETQYEGFDPTSPASYIKFNLLQNDNLNQSLEFATYVQDEFRNTARRVDRGVRQGPFWVLWATAMPSVLVETGYISNRMEEEFLITTEGQDILATAIYNAFKAYKKELEFRKFGTTTAVSAANETAASGKDPEATGIKSGTDTASGLAIAQSPEKTVAAGNENMMAKAEAPPPRNLIEYRVQILSSIRRIPEGASDFRGQKGFTEMIINGQYKYMSSPVTDYQEALVLRKKLAGTFPGAFIVPFRDGKKITLEEAMGK